MHSSFSDRVVRALAETPRPGNAVARSTKISYTNGDTYEGEACGTIAQPVRHGYGVYCYAGGQSRYEGEFVDDEKHGRGTLFLEDGSAYDGQWLGGRQHGHGVQVHWSPKASIWVYDGEFRAGLREGHGSLVARERGALVGTWTAGSLSRGVETRLGGEVSVLGFDTTEEELEGSDAAEEEEDLPLPRRVLGSTPQQWQLEEVQLWLMALGIKQPLEGLNGAQLLEREGVEGLVGQADGLALRAMVSGAHLALREVAEGPVRSWGELQAALPQTRIIPAAEFQAAEGVRREWRGMAVELWPLPMEAGVKESSVGGWAKDLEALATLRHPNLRTLLGVTSPRSEAEAPALVYEAGRGRLLFEQIHASLPDGRRPSLDFKVELRVGLDLCQALTALAACGLTCGALCSVNVELQQASGGGVSARLLRAGVCWWRWGWRGALRLREAGRRALTAEEVERRYASCPVNWLAPEVLRGQVPLATADVYSLGLVLWEMLYRAVPFGDFTIAQIVAAVGYGRRTLPSTVSAGASVETSFLHEVVRSCVRWEPGRRPSFAVLLESLREMLRAYEQRKAQKGVLGLLVHETEAFLSGGKKEPKQVMEKEEQGPRMVRLATGEWVQVHADLLEQFPGDEEKWRALMAFRARLPAGA